MLIPLLASAAGCSDPYEAERERQPGRASTIEPDARGGRVERMTQAARDRTRRRGGDARPPAVASARLPSLPDVSTHDLHRLMRAFTERWVNWNWRDPEAPYRALTPVTAGPLRRELVRTREAVAADSGLRRQRLGSRGHFVALSIHGRASARRLVVVAREELLLGGRGELEGPRHRVYLATARRAGVGWRMTRWERQP